MTDLCKLAAKYGTDKIHYTPFYSVLLDHKRNSTRKVLEIGIGTPAAMSHVPGYVPGASLRMWRDYFPDAGIYGIDKDPSVIFIEQRIQTACVDQTQPAQLRAQVKHIAPLDLIVDDGSHEVEHQLITAKTLLPYLRKGGLYIIEDVNKPEELLAQLTVPCSYVRVRGQLEGRCVIIYA